jgi:hypothetical protein
MLVNSLDMEHKSDEMGNNGRKGTGFLITSHSKIILQAFLIHLLGNRVTLFLASVRVGVISQEYVPLIPELQQRCTKMLPDDEVTPISNSSFEA